MTRPAFPGDECTHDMSDWAAYAGRRGEPRTVTVCTTCANGGKPDPVHALWRGIERTTK